MTDHDQFRLEPTEGERTGGPPGERLVVGLAAFALLAGLLIALGNFIGHGPVVTSVSSPTPRPTASSSQSARVWPPPRLLREVTLEPGTFTPPRDAPYPFSGWVRANADATVRANPELDAIELGVLPQGAVAFAEETPDQPPGDLGWLHIVAPQPEGWVATTEGGTLLVERIGPPPAAVSGDIWTVAAGEDVFLALGSSAGLSTESLPQLVATSADGDAWQLADLAATPNYGFVVSWGPVGWLALLATDRPEGSAVWVWQSDDGLTWAALGKMPDEQTEYPSQMVGSDAGYLLAASEAGGRETTFWFSEDGVTWRETAATGMSATAWFRLSAGPAGFYAWDMQGEHPADKVAAAYSADARTWAPVSDGPEGPTAQIIAVGAAWVGTDVEPGTGVRRLWVGEVQGKQPSWRREADKGEFSGAVVSTMVSDGRRAVAFGWDRSTEQPMAWIREGTAWVRSPLPDAFGGLPRVAAGGPSGIVVVGYRPTLRGRNPVFWHLAADGSWAPEKSPLLSAATNPAADECGPAPSTAVDFVVLEHAQAVACLANTPVTFRAWSVECHGCFGDAPAGNGQPAWLATPGRNQLALSPIENFDGWWASAVLDPLLQQDPAWTKSWLEVTGHFDDPAAIACRSTPSLDEELYYAGGQSVVDGCRLQFVVTSVTPVAGP